MSEASRAYRQFERFLFLTPHEPEPGAEGKILGTITYDFVNRTVTYETVEEERARITPDEIGEIQFK